MLRREFIMKTKFILFLLIPFFGFSQELYQVKTISNYEKLIADLDKDSVNVIYSLNKSELDNIIKQSNKKYTLIHNFAVWCAPCVENFPNFLELKRELNDNLLFLILTTDKNKSAHLTNAHVDFREKYNVNYPTFNISDEYAKGTKKKYNSFIQLIAPNHKDYGMGISILIRNEDQKVLYASTYKETKAEIIKKIKALVN